MNPTWNPIAKPGAMYEYFRGNPHGRNPLEMLRDREPLPAHYMDRDARVAVIERQGLEAVWLFPTLGVLYEELLKHDTEAVVTLVQAFNRWLEEDWGCNYKDKIYAAPYLSLADLDFAIRELDWALAQGARVVVMRPAPIWTALGPRSPADPIFDPFWARAAEAGITVVVHAGDSGYTTHGYTRDGFASGFDGAQQLQAVGEVVPDRARRLRLPDHAQLREALRAPSEPAHRVGGERLGVPAGSVPQARAVEEPHARLLQGGSRRRCSATTSGSTRSGRTTSTRSCG